MLGASLHLLVLLTLLVELSPFNSEATFKLFALNLPQVILSYLKALLPCLLCFWSKAFLIRFVTPDLFQQRVLVGPVFCWADGQK